MQSGPNVVFLRFILEQTRRIYYFLLYNPPFVIVFYSLFLFLFFNLVSLFYPSSLFFSFFIFFFLYFDISYIQSIIIPGSFFFKIITLLPSLYLSISLSNTYYIYIHSYTHIVSLFSSNKIMSSQSALHNLQIPSHEPIHHLFSPTTLAHDLSYVDNTYYESTDAASRSSSHSPTDRSYSKMTEKSQQSITRMHTVTFNRAINVLSSISRLDL